MRGSKRAKGSKRVTVSGGRFAVKPPMAARAPEGTVVSTPTVASGRERRIRKIVGEYRETFRALARK